MSNIPIKDALDAVHKVDVFLRTEGADVVETQAIALVDPTTGESVNLLEPLAEIAQKLAALVSLRSTDASMRVSVTAGTLGTVTSVTSVSTIVNQTSMGTYIASPQIPALMNMAAQNNIRNMIG